MPNRLLLNICIVSEEYVEMHPVVSVNAVLDALLMDVSVSMLRGIYRLFLCFWVEMSSLFYTHHDVLCGTTVLLWKYSAATKWAGKLITSELPFFVAFVLIKQ